MHLVNNLIYICSFKHPVEKYHCTGNCMESIMKHIILVWELMLRNKEKIMNKLVKMSSWTNSYTSLTNLYNVNISFELIKYYYGNCLICSMIIWHCIVHLQVFMLHWNAWIGFYWYCRCFVVNAQVQSRTNWYRLRINILG